MLLPNLFPSLYPMIEQHQQHRNEKTREEIHQNSEEKLFPAIQKNLNTENPSSWIGVE